MLKLSVCLGNKKVDLAHHSDQASSCVATEAVLQLLHRTVCQFGPYIGGGRNLLATHYRRRREIHCSFVGKHEPTDESELIAHL